MAETSTRNTTTTSGGLLHRPSFLAAAVLVLLLIGLGTFVVISNLTGSRDTTAAPAGPPALAPPQTPEASRAYSPSVCGLPGVEVSGGVPGPPDAHWTLVGTTAAPSADKVGPGIVDRDGFRRCFAHTPTGALFASANFVAIGSVAAFDQKIPQYLIAKGPGRDHLLQAPPEEPTGGVRVQIAGFRIIGYTGDTATIDIAMRTSKGAIAGQIFDLVWEDGDWKSRVTDQGDLLTQLVQLPDLSGYIPWAGA